MKNSLSVLRSLDEQIQAILQQDMTVNRSARRMLSALVSLTKAEGGSLSAWERGGEVAMCVTRGLDASDSRRIRRAVQNPPACPGEPLGRQGWSLITSKKGAESGWPDLDQAVNALAGPRCALAMWPFTWLEGTGLVLLCMSRAPSFAAGFTQAVSGYLGQAISVLLLKRRAASRGQEYRRIFENSKDMIYLSSRDGRWEDVNSAGVRMLGYESREQLLSKPDSALEAYLDGGDRSRFQAAIEKDGFVKDYEVRFKRRDGNPLWVSITAQVRRSEDGAVSGYEGIIKDISARKEAEARTERENRLIASILELVPVAIFVVGRDHRVLHWNRACEELTGVPRNEILGTDYTWKVFQRPPGVSLADVVLEQDLEKLQEVYGGERLRPSPLSPEAWEAEAHFNSLGGAPKDLFFTASLLRGPDGEVLGAVEAIMDSTQLKELECSLAESEQLYRTLVEANREGIALHDGERFVFANQAFMGMFGLDSLEQAPADFLEMIAPGSQRAYLEWIKDLSSVGGQLPVFEGQGARFDGVFDLEMIAAPAPYRGREASLFTLRDVSYRKRMEEQLIRSERLAATGKLAFDIAHEVNNPLGGILTYAHLLSEDLPSDEDSQNTIEKIIKLTNRCKIIVRGLLDFARHETQERMALDLNEVLKEMLSLMEGHVIMREIDLIMDLDPALPRFQGNRTKLEQVFLNMVVNAAEAMEGKGRLELSTWSNGDSGELCVRFKDNGPGMTQEVAARVFEPFFTTKSRGRGTGLGLSISHGIIKQHHGRLELETAPGQGTCLTICLPRHHPPENGNHKA